MEISDILNLLRNGKISIEEASRRINLLALSNIESACLDISRGQRKCVPEIVFAEGKYIDDLVRIIDSLLRTNGGAIVTRINEDQAGKLNEHFGNLSSITYSKRSRVMTLKQNPQTLPTQTFGKIAIITAGTADIGIAEEAKVVLEEMGCEVLSIFDVGIAGLHRTFPAIRKCLEEDVDAIIVVAGMEGALASVISSLVSLPVIGVPSSSGYGMGGKGEGALLSMLQSCSPGLVVVNIDNGVGAAVAAALIARRAQAKNKH